MAVHTMERGVGPAPDVACPTKCTPQRCFALLLAIVTLTCHGANPVRGADDLIKPDDLVGRKVAIETRTGEKLDDAEVIKVQADKTNGSLRTISVRDPKTDKPRTFVGSMIVSLSAGPGTVRYIFDAKSKRLLPDDPALLARLHEDSPKDDAKRPSPKPRKEKTETTESPSKTKSGAKPRVADNPKNTFPEIPLRPKVRRWKEQSKEDRAAAIAEHKAFFKKVTELLPASRFTFVETNYFLILSDMPPRDTQAFAPYCDALYARLIAMFNLKPGTNVFRGKAPVIIFASKNEYIEFEVKLCHANPETPRNRPALVNYESVGNSLIAGTSERKAGAEIVATMVHETTHAFLFRYKTKEWIPSWANEGLAQVMESVVVPQFNGVRQSEQEAILYMRRGGRIGNLFEKDYIGMLGDPSTLQIKYGVAGNFTRYLIARDARRYGQFIEAMKAGMKDMEALQYAYGVSGEQLLQQYGLTLGIRNLAPQ